MTAPPEASRIHVGPRGCAASTVPRKWILRPLLLGGGNRSGELHDALPIYLPMVLYDRAAGSVADPRRTSRVRRFHRAPQVDSAPAAFGGRKLEKAFDRANRRFERPGAGRLQHRKLVEAGNEQLYAEQLPSRVETRAACAPDADARIGPAGRDAGGAR